MIDFVHYQVLYVIIGLTHGSWSLNQSEFTKTYNYFKDIYTSIMLLRSNQSGGRRRLRI